MFRHIDTRPIGRRRSTARWTVSPSGSSPSENVPDMVPITSARLRTVARLGAAALLGLLAAIAIPGVASADAVRDDQWQLQELNATDAWQLADGADVVVAVVDSGVDAAHPDL